MKPSTNWMLRLAAVMTVALFAACAPTVPKELADARTAYRRAAAGPAAQHTPAELHKARESLTVAEQAFADDPDAQRTRDLAYVAERRAQLAEALASQQLEIQRRSDADRMYRNKQAQLAQATRGELSQARQRLQEGQARAKEEQQQLADERHARSEAEQRAVAAEAQNKQLQENLATLAAVKEEPRGLVLTLSGSVLFVSDSATLLPEAQTRLNQVAEAMMASKDRDVIVEGFTDSRGSASHNLDLSQRRAEAVRNYIVGRGFPSERIRAQGMGLSSPIADNQTAEGRANNRRVEIVIQPPRS